MSLSPHLSDQVQAEFGQWGPKFSDELIKVNRAGTIRVKDVKRLSVLAWVVVVDPKIHQPLLKLAELDRFAAIYTNEMVSQQDTQNGIAEAETNRHQ